jgi:hypothetical protein
MATVLALIAAVIFAVSTVLQQKGGLEAPPLSLRHPRSFVRLAGQGTWRRRSRGRRSVKRASS